MFKPDLTRARSSRVLRTLLLIGAVTAGLLALVFGAAAQEEPSSAPASAVANDNEYGAFLPDEMSYQGQLVDDNGVPQVGTYSMEFGIYGPPPTSTLRYTETQTVATDPEGLFNVMIGAVEPGLGDALAGGDAWLEVQIEGEILAPQQPIGSVAYAQYAQRLVGGTGFESTIGGGNDNVASATWTTVSGGIGNEATANSATIGGGNSNDAAERGATVGGGGANWATGAYATVAGGRNNRATAEGAFVGGGGYDNGSIVGNKATATGSAIVGGWGNLATDEYATVGGGYRNEAGDDDGTTVDAQYATVSGGALNRASGESSTVGGGTSNQATGLAATVGGGDTNTAGTEATVGGGSENSATGAASTVGGGFQNDASGFLATIPGGAQNVASASYTFAAGLGAEARHLGAFVWSSSSGSFISTGVDQFLIDADGGVGVDTNAPQSQLHVVDTLNGTATSFDAHVATIENTSSSTSPDVLALATGATNPGGSVNYVTFFDSSGAIAAIEGNGSGGVTYATSGADFAEYLPLDRTVRAAPAPGTVLGLSGDTLTLDTGSARRVMVVSAAAGFVGNARDAEGNDGTALVAFMGQVPVQVRGAVTAGDLLVASGLNDGMAVAIAPSDLTPAMAGQIIGQALESNYVGGVTLINVLVGQPNDAFWAALLAESQTRLDDVESRLAELEAAMETLLEANDE